MKPETIARVRHSYRLLGPIAPLAAEVFAENLVRRAPQMRALLRDDLSERHEVLTRALGFAVANLDAPEVLVPTLESLGARHAALGGEDGDYFSAGAAFLDTLAAALGGEWTDEVELAWAETYALIARCVRNGAAHARAAIPPPANQPSEPRAGFATGTGGGGGRISPTIGPNDPPRSLSPMTGA